MSRNILSFFTWVAYLSADWFATTSLGNLANNQVNGKNSSLQVLWAPFLLLHLGGPDTITAYALEDNSLWLRHLVGLAIQVGAALNIYIRSWSRTPLTFIAIPVFLSGIIKYSERTWVLRSASPVTFEDSLLSSPAPEPLDLQHIPPNSDLELVHQGYSSFHMVKRLYADLSLRFAEGQRSYALIVNKADKHNYAFKLVEVQLSFLFDVLYTKASLIYSIPGLILRLTSFLAISCALVAFLIFVDTASFSRVDINITFALFIGAIVLEICAFISLICSDWTKRWLTKNKSWLMYLENWASCLRCQKRWSGCLAQHNLLSFCMSKRVSTCIRYNFLFRMYCGLELYWQRTWKKVNDDLRELIFQQLLDKHKAYNDKGFDDKFLTELLSHRGEYVLKDVRYNCFDEIGWSIEMEFDHSLLVWHVATDIHYSSTPANDNNKEREVSKMLSDYMLYVLLMRPFLLPKWIDRITYIRDTIQDAARILHRRQFPVKVGVDASTVLIQMYRQSHHPIEQRRKERSSKSVLLDGCHLASQFQNLGCPWGMISQVWIEMLAYAATQCEWNSHAQQLRRGGELLTHVCLVMANLGLNKQFEIGRRGPPIGIQNGGCWGWAKSKIIDPQVICETDSLEAYLISQSSNMVMNQDIRDLQSKVIDILHWDWTAQIQLIQREANSVADSMAKKTATLQHDYVEWIVPHPSLVPLIRMDCYVPP
ncbi:hypothetical protein PIB30_044717 [Stylosanthes scabra]|uniref:DUF4220 domain-containing protein n=1 Tax=Stylosanthes scabra TaxID=79078 RepID=A0ABU6VDU3_9FABA|nr:hypothetical protein [Stylosanthes scabra]